MSRTKWIIGLLVILLLAVATGVGEGFRGGRRGGGRRGGGRRHGGSGWRRGGRRWMGMGRGYGYGPRRAYWANQWSPGFYGTCKNGCTSTGNGTWGCQYPGVGRDDCLFATDCQWCGGGGGWWW
jgi:hypothetical protein